jgi:hypothetical protein
MRGDLKQVLKIRAAEEGRNLADLLEDGALLYLQSVGVTLQSIEVTKVAA